jgi:integrase
LVHWSVSVIKQRARVPSPDEVRSLIEAAGNLMRQTALPVAYGAGLRASEVVVLKVSSRQFNA